MLKTLKLLAIENNLRSHTACDVVMRLRDFQGYWSVEDLPCPTRDVTKGRTANARDPYAASGA